MKLTPWFPGTVTPVRPGVYERRIWPGSRLLYYAYWTGKRWGVACTDKEHAKDLAYMASSHQTCSWRGVLKGKS